MDSRANDLFNGGQQLENQNKKVIILTVSAAAVVLAEVAAATVVWTAVVDVESEVVAELETEDEDELAEVDTLEEL